MKSYEIHPDDLYRIFIGGVPVAFFLEAFIRTVFIYLLLVVSMRLMGKRMSSQLSRNELVSIVCLAAAIGVPLQSPDRGLLAAAVIAFIVVTVEWYISVRSFKNQRFEQKLQGNISILVKDGVLQLNAMKTTLITRERLVAQLRIKGIKSTGEVKRLYIEAGGDFTVIKDDGRKAGLCIIPDWDPEFIQQLEHTDERVCCYCGNHNDSGRCSNCGSDKTVNAVR